LNFLAKVQRAGGDTSDIGKKERLYLINIRSYRKHPRHIQPSIQQFFPNQADGFAEWFNGIIQLEDGKRLKSFGRAGYLFEKISL